MADPCALTLLVSVGTCSAICLHYQVTVPQSGDGCCPPGATNDIDSDCPTACGNGVRQGSESCDSASRHRRRGAVPTTATTANACTTDFLSGAGCQAVCGHDPIDGADLGRRLLPVGATNATDTDCPAKCGNGVVERGESCDSSRHRQRRLPDQLSPCRSRPVSRRR